MSPRALRRPSTHGPWRRAAALAALALGTTALAGLAPMQVRTAAWGVDRPDAAALTVGAMSPEVAQPGGTLRINGTVRAGAESLSSGIVRLRVGLAPITLRDQLAAVADGTTTPATTPAATEQKSVDLAADQTRAWSLSVDLDSLGLGTAGAYALVVDLDSATTGLTQTSVTTFLSWYPSSTAAQPTRVVWAVPLVGSPARDADGVFVDDRTATTISAGGRVRTLLDALAGTPTSWFVDPELLEAARDMSDGYEVRNDDGDVVAGGAASATAAQAFLTAARSDLATADVSSLGYADPDANALQRGGLANDLTLATTKGPPITNALLGRRVRGNLGWPPGDTADRATLATLRAAGTRAVVLADTSVPVDPSLTYTPTALVRIPTSAGAVTGVLSDSTLDTVVGAPAAEGGEAVARARYLAETLVITQQRPSDQRTIVVAPPRTWDVDAAFARTLVTAGGRVPWLQSTSMAQLLAQAPPNVPRGTLTATTDTDRKAELSRAQVDGARELGTGVDTFAGVLAEPAATSDRYTAAQLRTESAAFRTQRAAGTTLLSAIDANLDRDRSKVRVLSHGMVRLAGASGQIPITVANDLDQSVVVGVRLVPRSAVKLRIDQPSEVRLGPHKKETIEVGARAATGGTVPVDVVLLTQDGTPYAAPATLQVRSTAYSRVGLVIIVVALAALMALVVARLTRRLRARRRSA